MGCVRVVPRSPAATSLGLCLQGCVAQGAPCKGVGRRAARKVRLGGACGDSGGVRRACVVLQWCCPGFVCSHEQR